MLNSDHDLSIFNIFDVFCGLCDCVMYRSTGLFTAHGTVDPQIPTVGQIPAWAG